MCTVCPGERAFRWHRPSVTCWASGGGAGKRGPARWQRGERPLVPEPRRKAGRRWGPAANRVGGQACRCRGGAGSGFLGRAGRKRLPSPRQNRAVVRGGRESCFRAVDGSGWLATEDKTSPVRGIYIGRCHSGAGTGPHCAGVPGSVIAASERLYPEAHARVPGWSHRCARTMCHCEDGARWPGRWQPRQLRVCGGRRNSGYCLLLTRPRARPLGDEAFRDGEPRGRRRETASDGAAAPGTAARS